ncbi:MAG: fasciclin domain-containing protein [Winogradskyella sp.]|uniref:fasciclin domain-containing protein n=1 Tax=Winogradskyella sp. TaxID=1883156 RepID=UPI001814C779|nr:fasciclin domain-containing protein [Winogradskyella sp.]
MKKIVFKKLTLTLALLFSFTLAFAQMGDSNVLEGVKDTKKYKTIEVIQMDKDLSVLTSLLYMSGLNESLESLEGEHTLFAPTNAAFADMSIEAFAELTNPENRAELVSFLNLHFLPNKVMSSDLNDTQKVDTPNGTISVYKNDSTIGFGGAVIENADLETKNGVIHITNSAVAADK